MQKLYNAGIYVRLSTEDTANTQKRGKGNPFQHESTSIENQKAVLQEYAHLRGWSVARVYADDRYSGGNYSRPGLDITREKGSELSQWREKLISSIFSSSGS